MAQRLAQRFVFYMNGWSGKHLFHGLQRQVMLVLFLLAPVLVYFILCNGVKIFEHGAFVMIAAGQHLLDYMFAVGFEQVFFVFLRRRFGMTVYVFIYVIVVAGQYFKTGLQ